MFSATLHDPLIKDMADIICKFPQWIDLKGKDTVPEVSNASSLILNMSNRYRQTVDHAVVIADPVVDKSWQGPGKRIQTDGIHAKENIDKQNPSANPASLSEATKLLKAELLRKIIDTHKMDSALILFEQNSMPITWKDILRTSMLCLASKPKLWLSELILA